ncbi:MAG TPA: endonuclease/exonuclease/phosphatase family protein [Candidatus Cybelea sp.]|nr:endonuclease/exonuclease/phosphatase family protein [Candidatus Cybelea sp.]
MNRSFTVATLNVDNLGRRHGRILPLDAHIAMLRPLLAALAADVLCLQEVNAQKLSATGVRSLADLTALLSGTRYEAYARISSVTPGGGLADIHNLVVLSRLPVLSHRQYWQDLVSAPDYRVVTASPPDMAARPVAWDRPALHLELDLNGRVLHVFNLHLRAPLAAAIQGQKIDADRWRSASGWAEGFMIAALKRAGQALEVRLAVDRILDAAPDALIVVAGDFNADAHEMPLRILCASQDDVQTPELADRSLVPVEETLPVAERYTIRHAGAKLMVDHLLVSQALRPLLIGASIRNRDVPDDTTPAGARLPGPAHAAFLAEFAVPE